MQRPLATRSRTADHHHAFLALDAAAAAAAAAVSTVFGILIHPAELGDSCAESWEFADAETPVKGNACHLVEGPPDLVGTRGEGKKGLATNTVRQSRQSCEERRRVRNHFPTLFFHFEVVGRKDFDACSDSGYSCRGVVHVGDGGHRIA